jgi:hypothetical protein
VKWGDKPYRCGLPAVTFIWRGGNAWKLWMCAEHYDEFREWKRRKGLPDDYSESVLD